MASPSTSRLPSFEARFASAHAGDADREAADRAQWQRDMDKLQLQMHSMEESISLLEREVKSTVDKLAAAPKTLEFSMIILGDCWREAKGKCPRLREARDDSKKRDSLPMFFGLRLKRED